MADNGNNPKNRLWFFTDLLKAGLSQKELAKVFNVSPQNLNASLKRDDMKLSLIEKRLGDLGYTFSFSLRLTDKPERKYAEMGRLLDYYYGRKRGARLENLKLFQIAYGITNKNLAEPVRMNQTGVNRWFKVDDISISYLYIIAQHFDAELEITVKKKQKTNEQVL